MTVRSIQSIAEDKDVVSYAAVYVEASNSPRCLPKKKRITMIAREMDVIMKDAQDYLLRHMIDDDLGDEAKNALLKAAMKSSYLKHYYDTINNKVVYYPTCQDLILNHDFIEEAEKFYYTEKDMFPPEYSRAINNAVRAAENERQLMERKRQARNEDDESDEESISYDDDDDDDDLLATSMHVRIDSEMVDKFAGSWRDVYTDTETDEEEEEGCIF